jgi:multidrug efflux system membrane fusion protein
MSTPTKRFILSATVVAMLGAGTGTILASRHATAETKATAPAAAQVDVATVVSRDITDWQDYSGRLEAVDHVDIRPQVTGTLTSVNFKDGSYVNKGDVLFTIDPRPYAAEVARAQAQLAAVDANVTFTAANLARSQRLITDNAISRSDYEQTQNAAKAAVANQLAAAAALTSAKLNLEYTRITAPVSGRVSRAEVTVGNLVAAGGAAQVLTTLVSTNHVYAAFDVDEQTFLKYINPARSGQGSAAPVYLGLVNESDFPRLGHVSSVDNSLNTSSGTIRVRAEFDNPNGVLLPGLYARIRLGGGQPHAGILISEQSVGTDQDKRFVLVLDSSNKTAYREVKLGAQQDGLQVVSSGLAAGDRIVVNGLQRVQPGDAVTPNVVQMPSNLPAPIVAAKIDSAPKDSAPKNQVKG